MSTTRSEELFAAICQRHGYRATSIPPSTIPERKTADFRVITSLGTFIAEVEELQPNKDDLRQIREMKEKGMTSGGGTIGSRARNAIRDASIQLRAHQQEGLPLLIVLYDNVRTPDGRVAYPMYYLEPHHIDAAMYGDLVVFVPMRPGVERRPDRSGGKRTMTPNQKTYISAVAVISDWDDQTIYVFHNFFAQRPFPRGIFTDAKCHHYRKGGEPYADPWKWCKVVAD